ncbi:unnamed protein product [Caenorhabditis brenneri]
MVIITYYTYLSTRKIAIMALIVAVVFSVFSYLLIRCVLNSVGLYITKYRKRSGNGGRKSEQEQPSREFSV